MNIYSYYKSRDLKVLNMFWKCVGNGAEMIWKCFGNVLDNLGNVLELLQVMIF